MKYQIFISFSSANIIKIREFIFELNKKGIDAFCSDKDIKPGDSFDKTIQDAIEYSSYVIVFVSKSSVDSEYVRSEVEYALNNSKTVIPVLLDNVSVPLRWNRLQYIKSNDDVDKTISELMKVLPVSDILQFKTHLDATTTNVDEKLRNLIIRNPQWVLYPHTPVTDMEINKFDELKGLDYFFAGSDSGGVRAGFFILLSAEKSSFLNDGKLTNELEDAIKVCKRTIQNLTKFKYPHKLLEVDHYRTPHYAYFDVRIIAGRNIHYPPEILRKREQITKDFYDTDNEYIDFLDTDFQLLSYDWLYINACKLEKAIQNSDNGLK